MTPLPPLEVERVCVCVRDVVVSIVLVVVCDSTAVDSGPMVIRLVYISRRREDVVPVKFTAFNGLNAFVV